MTSAVGKFGISLALALSMGVLAGCVPTQSANTSNPAVSELGSSTSGGSPSDLHAGAPAVPSTARIAGGNVNQGDSRALTDYLKNHQLPLVGAQVIDAPSGSRQVILFGFVATSHGQTDAESKTRNFLKDSAIAIDNRIKVSPELAHAAPGPQAAPPPAASPDEFDSMGTAQSYQDQQALEQLEQQQQYQNQQSAPSVLTTLIPLLGLLVGSGSFGGGSFGGYGSPYGGYGGYGYPPYPSPPPPSGYYGSSPPPGYFP